MTELMDEPKFVDISVTGGTTEVLVAIDGNITHLNYEDAVFLRDALDDQVASYEEGHHEPSGE